MLLPVLLLSSMSSKQCLHSSSSISFTFTMPFVCLSLPESWHFEKPIWAQVSLLQSMPVFPAAFRQTSPGLGQECCTDWFFFFFVFSFWQRIVSAQNPTKLFTSLMATSQVKCLVLSDCFSLPCLTEIRRKWQLGDRMLFAATWQPQWTVRVARIRATPILCFFWCSLVRELEEGHSGLWQRHQEYLESCFNHFKHHEQLATSLDLRTCHPVEQGLSAHLRYWTVSGALVLRCYFSLLYTFFVS